MTSASAPPETSPSSPSPPRFVERLFSFCLRAYPRVFRERMGPSMAEAFFDGYTEASRRGVFVVRTLVSLLAAGGMERCRPSLEAASASTSTSTSTSSSMNLRHPRRRNSMSTRLGVLIKEIRFALRSLLLRPGFAAIAILTLALGVGANTAIFSVVHGVLLSPLDYHEPERLITVNADWKGPDAGIGSMSYPDIADLERESRSIESLIGVNASSMTLTGLGDPVVLSVTRLTKGLMEPLRVAPALGRDIRADEFGKDAPYILVVSHDFWQSQLGGDPDVLGKTLMLSGYAHEIVGVAPPGFHYPEDAELWTPRRMDIEDCGRGCHTMRVIGRLTADATLESARAEAEQIAASLREEYPDTNTYKSFLVRSLQDQIVGDVRSGLLLLLGAVGLVALIACANVANLLLARASSRTGEIAIRTAIGASRARLVAQSLLESGLLALFGGALGLALAWGSLALLPHVASDLPRMGNVRIDSAVLLFTLGAVVLVTFLFGLAPAFALVRSNVRSGLGSGAAGSMGESQSRRRFRAALLVGEVALSAFLLVGAGLVLRSFTALYTVDLGFDPRDVTRFNLLLPDVRYDSIDAVRSFYRELESRIATIPGVESVGSVWGPPFGNTRATGGILVEGRPEPPPELEREASIHSVGPGFFQTMRIPLRRGRLLDARDDTASEPVAVLNEAFVRDNFPDEDPIGRLVRVTVNLGYGSPYFRIVGIVGDIRSRRIGEDPQAEIYVPHGVFGPENLTINIRTTAGVSNVNLIPQVRGILEEMDATIPMYRVETVDEAFGRQLAPTRFYLVLIGAFAVLAALLAAVGLYGVVAYNTSRRTRELGLRLALGAEQAGVLKLVLVQGMLPALVGLGVGLVAAFFGGHVMNAILFGVEPRDPSIFAATAVVLFVVALVATLLPAHRASRVDPVVALRLS